MERQQTNSITHLVKIVAKEVIADELLDFENRLALMENNQVIINDMENAGETWLKNEDDKLISSYHLALEIIAKQHGRSTGAIKARIKLLGLGVI